MNVTLLNVLRRFVNCSRRGSGPLVIQVKWRNKRETNERRIKKKWNNFHICNNGIQLYLWSHFATYKCISYCELYSHNFPIPFGSFFFYYEQFICCWRCLFITHPPSPARRARQSHISGAVYTQHKRHIFFFVFALSFSISISLSNFVLLLVVISVCYQLYPIFAMAHNIYVIAIYRVAVAVAAAATTS